MKKINNLITKLMRFLQKLILNDDEGTSDFTMITGLFMGILFSISGIISYLGFHSYWLLSIGIYYGTLVIARIYLTLQIRKKYSNVSIDEKKVLRNVSIFVLLLDVTLSGMAYQMMFQKVEIISVGYLIYYLAFYFFFYLISSIALFIKREKNNYLKECSLILCMVDSLMSALTLEVSMINQFADNYESVIGLNRLTALIVIISVGIIAIYGFVRSWHTNISQDIKCK